jgi:crossover junction endodeoxyribonuclease RuvC
MSQPNTCSLATGRQGGMRVLGVDPGLTRCGIGVVEGVPGRPLVMVATGVARTSPDDDIGQRLLAIERHIEEWMTAYQPDAVAVERVFSQHNVSTVMGTAQASAVAIVCAARRGLPVALHTPTEVKAAVTGSGRADKAQVTAMVVRLLRLTDAPRPADAADALALAICHIWRGGAQARLAAATSGQAAAVRRAAAARQAALHQESVRQASVRQTSVRQTSGRQTSGRQTSERQTSERQAAIQRAGPRRASGPEGPATGGSR